MGKARIALVARMTGPTTTHQPLPTVDELFTAAVHVVQNLPKDGPVSTSNEHKLRFYALFKQATVGPCNIPSPAFWNIVERYKWDAWSSLGSMDSDAAKEEYVAELNGMIDSAMLEHNFVPWLSDRLQTLLRSSFSLLGYEWTSFGLKESPSEGTTTRGKSESVKGDRAESSHAELDDNAVDRRQPATEGTLSDSLDAESGPVGSASDVGQSAQAYGSDDDYADATDGTEHFHLMAIDAGEDKSCSSVSSGSPDQDGIPRQRSTERVSPSRETNQQRPVSTAYGHLQALLRRLTVHRNLLCAVQWLMPPSEGVLLNWRTMIFLLVWPIIVNILIRYLPVLKRFF